MSVHSNGLTISYRCCVKVTAKDTEAWQLADEAGHSLLQEVQGPHMYVFCEPTQQMYG